MQRVVEGVVSRAPTDGFRARRWTGRGAVLGALALSTLASAAESGSDSRPARANGEEVVEDEDVGVRWLLLRRRAWRGLPDAPSSPTVTVDSPDSLAVVWGEPLHTPTEVVGYDVEYRPEADPIFTNWPHEGTATSTTITGLVSSTTHLVRVRAINDAGSGDWSEPGRGMTPNAPPVFREGATTIRIVVENAPASQDVGAPVSATDVEDATLAYALTGPDAWRFDIVADSGQLRTRRDGSYDHEDDAEYEVTVTAEDSRGAGAGIAVEILVADVAEPPGQPVAPAVTATSLTSLRVSWTAPTNTGPAITDYDHRYRAVAAGSAWIEVNDTTDAGTHAGIAGLVRGTTYEVQVRASNDEGIGDWSPSGSATVPGINRAPTFLEGDIASRSVVENTVAERNVGSPVSATDLDGNALSYGLEGRDAARFTIVAATGQLRTRSGAVYDHELNSIHRVR